MKNIKLTEKNHKMLSQLLKQITEVINSEDWLLLNKKDYLTAIEAFKRGSSQQ